MITTFRAPLAVPSEARDARLVCAPPARSTPRSPPWNLRQEFAAVLALAPSHTIRALELGVPALTGPTIIAERQAD